MLKAVFRNLALSAVLVYGAHASAAGSLPPQSSTESAVTVKVTPQNMEGQTWDFEVVFDTHSQALNDDLVKEATLITQDGKQITPINWQGDPPGGHHRKGVLRFDAPKVPSSTVELRISRPNEAKPRSFRWELK